MIISGKNVALLSVILMGLAALKYNTMTATWFLASNDNNVFYSLEYKESRNTSSGSGASIVFARQHYNSSITDYEVDYNKDSSESNYTWENETSFRWIPPTNSDTGLPQEQLTIQELAQIFANENTLILSDSTGRQDYHTLYWLLQPLSQLMVTTTNNHDASIMNLLSQKWNQKFKDSSSLEYVFSNPKVRDQIKAYQNTGAVCCLKPSQTYCPRRMIPKKYKDYLLNVGWLFTPTISKNNTSSTSFATATAATTSFWNATAKTSSITSSNSTTSSNHRRYLNEQQQQLQRHADERCYENSRRGGQTSLPERGKLDLADARIKCLPKILDMAQQYSELLQKYTTIILSTGIFGVVMCNICNVTRHDPQAIYSPGDELVALLDYFETISGPNRTVLWKIHGPSSMNDNHELVDTRGEKCKDWVQKGEWVGVDEFTDRALVQTARRWFAARQPPYMRLLDFRNAIRERSHGTLRIRGDSPQHWGLEARLLGIDMMARAVLDRQQKRKQEEEESSKRTRILSKLEQIL